MSLTGISVYTDKQIIDELYARLGRGAIRLELLDHSDTHATVKVCGNTRDGVYGFQAAAYPPKVGHING